MDYGFPQKSRGKSKQVNVIIASTIEPDSNINSLTDSEKEEKILAADITKPLVATTCSCQPYLINYDDSLVQQLERSQESVVEPAEQPRTTPEKLMEVRNNKPLNKKKRLRFL